MILENQKIHVIFFRMLCLLPNLPRARQCVLKSENTFGGGRESCTLTSCPFLLILSNSPLVPKVAEYALNVVLIHRRVT